MANTLLIEPESLSDLLLAAFIALAKEQHRRGENNFTLAWDYTTCINVRGRINMRELTGQLLRLLDLENGVKSAGILSDAANFDVSPNIPIELGF